MKNNHNYSTYDHPMWKLFSNKLKENSKCSTCNSKYNLQLHHKSYNSTNLYWEYSDNNFEVLCNKCHKSHHISNKMNFRIHPKFIDLLPELRKIYSLLFQRKIERDQGISQILSLQLELTPNIIEQIWWVTGYYPDTLNKFFKITSLDTFEKLEEIKYKYY